MDRWLRAGTKTVNQTGGRKLMSSFPYSQCFRSKISINHETTCLHSLNVKKTFVFRMSHIPPVCFAHQ